MLGLVRHMAEMERAYGVWALGPKAGLEWVWGSYENDAEDDIDCEVTMVAESMQVWQGENRRPTTRWARIQAWTMCVRGTASAIGGTSPNSSASTPDTMVTPT